MNGTLKLLLFFLCLAHSAAWAQEPLERGVNLSHWLQYWGRQPVIPAELKKLKQVGFDHVRLPFDPALYGWQPPSPEVNLQALDMALAMILDAGLTVILDVHPGVKMALRIETEETFQQAFVALWAKLASHYSNISEDRLVFELLNEPQYYDTPPTAYRNLMQETLKVVRQSAPRHRVLIDAIHGGSISGLEGLEGFPPDDSLGFVFHYYLPYFFTHLNAPWEPFSEDVNAMVAGLMYPAYLTTIGQLRLLPGANLLTVTQAVRQYTSEGWNSIRIAREIGAAKAWAKRLGAPLLCNEFGVIRIGTDDDSQARWLKDVRTALEKSGFGWTVWDYGDAFGIADATGLVKVEKDSARVSLEHPPKPRVFRPKALAALGLHDTP
ncbi:Glycoside hydrolase family 5 domain-containing protein [Gammaproteobacteria bacterium]